jgi:hypothetical protein
VKSNSDRIEGLTLAGILTTVAVAAGWASSFGNSPSLPVCGRSVTSRTSSASRSALSTNGATVARDRAPARWAGTLRYDPADVQSWLEEAA